MNIYWSNFKKVCLHKYYVFKVGRRNGLGVVRLLLHDWDKFAPKMFTAYARMFSPTRDEDYPPQNSRKHGLCMQFGSSCITLEQVESEFKLRWNRHQKVCKHHWQAWVHKSDDSGEDEPIEMDYYDMIEMVSDWEGARLAYNSTETMLQWYTRTRGARKLHPLTLAWVDRHIGYDA